MPYCTMQLVCTLLPHVLVLELSIVFDRSLNHAVGHFMFYFLFF